VIEGETSIKIGELLVRAGILTGVDLSEAEKLSKHMQLQFGRVLIKTWSRRWKRKRLFAMAWSMSIWLARRSVFLPERASQSKKRWKF
jgi:hypothetical protein